jgi:hypothetical protein
MIDAPRAHGIDLSELELLSHFGIFAEIHNLDAQARCGREYPCAQQQGKKTSACSWQSFNTLNPLHSANLLSRQV